MKRSCSAKKTINKRKKQPPEWETVSANKATNTWLISKTYKQSLQLNIKVNKQTNQWLGRRPK